jgi:hypothetical protein
VAAVEVAVGERREAGHGEEVGYHIAFDFEVEGGVGVHRGRMVDLEKPRFEGGVDHDVEAQHLEAAVDEGHAVLEGAVEEVLGREDGFYDEIVDSVEEVGHLAFADVEG